MTRQAFKFTLWRKLPWWRGGDTVAVVEREQMWLDVENEAETVEWVAEMITRYGGREDHIGQYAADVLDLGTEQLVTRLSPSLADLRRVRSPASPLGQQGQPGSPALTGATDEDLVRELCRRLTQRR